jgi:hypothetical protein
MEKEVETAVRVGDTPSVLSVPKFFNLEKFEKL